MIPSSSLNTPPLPINGLPARPLSTNLASPPLTSLAQRRRNNKNLSLQLSPSDQQLSSISPSTPFLDIRSFSTSLHHVQKRYYRQGPIAIMPGLYLGDEHNASNVQQLKDLSIHCVINVAAEVEHPYAHAFQPWDQALLNHSNATIAPCPTLSSSSSASAASTNSTMTLPRPTSPTLAKTDSVYSAMGYKKRPWHHHILDNNDNETHQSSIQKELHAAVADVARARQSERNTLVHCQCGLARSATVVVAYVMYELGLSMSAALHYVKASAPHINPNLSLLYLLREYEVWLLATRSPSEQHDQPLVGAVDGATKTSTSSRIKKLNNNGTLSSSFLKKHQSSASSLVAKCKSFKFKKSSPYAAPFYQDLSGRFSSTSK